jgi:hypothetical protein
MSHNLVVCSAGIMVQMSFFVVYLMGNVTTWRIAAGISASLPVITAIYVTQVRGQFQNTGLLPIFLTVNSIEKFKHVSFMSSILV